MTTSFDYLMAALLSLTIGIAGIVIAVAIVTARDDAPRVPKCQEDEWVDGEGSFDNGYWSQYVCLSD